jgi:hypothetical protein
MSLLHLIFCPGAFGAPYAKNSDYRGATNLWLDGSLKGIKIHSREFLYDFVRETQQTPVSNSGHSLRKSIEQ